MVDGFEQPPMTDSTDPDSCLHARVVPKFARNLERIDAGDLPPGTLIAGAVGHAVLGAAEWYREFIAGLATKRARLHESQVMRIRRLAARRGDLDRRCGAYPQFCDRRCAHNHPLHITV